MSRGELFPNLHGQLDVTGLAFHIFDAPSSFSVCPSLVVKCLLLLVRDAFAKFQYIILSKKKKKKVPVYHIFSISLSLVSETTVFVVLLGLDMDILFYESRILWLSQGDLCILCY
jgi:hypothetical protein